MQMMVELYFAINIYLDLYKVNKAIMGSEFYLLWLYFLYIRSNGHKDLRRIDKVRKFYIILKIFVIKTYIMQKNML